MPLGPEMLAPMAIAVLAIGEGARCGDQVIEFRDMAAGDASPMDGLEGQRRVESEADADGPDMDTDPRAASGVGGDGPCGRLWSCPYQDQMLSLKLLVGTPERTPRNRAADAAEGRQRPHAARRSAARHHPRPAERATACLDAIPGVCGTGRPVRRDRDLPRL